MMHIKPKIIASIAIIILINWASQPEKQGAHYFGTLETRQGNTYTIDNIGIGYEKKTDTIPVYEKPQKSNAFTIVDTTHTALTIDPKKDLAVIYLDLNKIAQIQVPKPHETLTYKKGKGYREHTYIEIAIVEKNKPTLDTIQTPTSYLIEEDTYIYCTRIGTKAPEKMKVKLPALKYLSIEGYIFEKEQQSTECPPCPHNESGMPVAQKK